MRDVLKAALSDMGGLVELRYHNKSFRSFRVVEGRLDASTVRHREGVGVRVLHQGCWGFSATSDTSVQGVRAAIDAARTVALASAAYRRERVPELPTQNLAQGDYVLPGVAETLARSTADRVGLAVDTEQAARSASRQLRSTACTYNEIHEEKVIVTTDGADVRLELVRPELLVSAVAASDSGGLVTAGERVGVPGGWDCLFRDVPAAMAEKTTRNAVELLRAPQIEGGRATVILSPAVVGLLVHEAVGHTVEADFVQAGSVAAGKLGQRVASELVTLCDSGQSEYITGAGGTVLVDDEGIIAGRTAIIERGFLRSYLHSRESAARFGVAPTGNARAWEYADQPLIRMRNTYIAPGDSDLDDMIAGVEDGYLLDGPQGGQADATGEFMFGVAMARRIRNGKLGELVRGVTVTGNAFAVLQTVDAVSSAFRWDLGAGHCGKGQPAKVDAGGPYIRCQVLLGGKQG